MVELENADLFRLLKPAELAEIKEAAQERSFGAGQEIFREGDPGDGLYVVKTGLVEISGQLSRNHRQVFSQIRPGQMFGEMALIDRLPRSAFAIAAQATRVTFLEYAAMQKLIERAPGFAAGLLQLVSHRLREFNQHYLREVLQAERLAAVGQFARSIVHDLKNPLNIISLTTEMLSKPDAPLPLRATAMICQASSRACTYSTPSWSRMVVARSTPAPTATRHANASFSCENGALRRTAARLGATRVDTGCMADGISDFRFLI